jgi:hypothetical protein
LEQIFINGTNLKLNFFSKIGTNFKIGSNFQNGTNFEIGIFKKWNKLRIGTNFEKGTTCKLEEIPELEQITN